MTGLLWLLVVAGVTAAVVRRFLAHGCPPDCEHPDLDEQYVHVHSNGPDARDCTTCDLDEQV